MAEEKRESAFLLSVESQWNYVHICAVAGCVGQTPNGPEWHGASSYFGDQPYLDSLQVRCQGDNGDTAAHRRLYGFEVEYRPFSVDLLRAEAMVKTLRHVERVLQRCADRFGRVDSFADYAVRVAMALGIRTFMVVGVPHATMSAGEAHNWLRDKDSRWVAGEAIS